MRGAVRDGSKSDADASAGSAHRTIEEPIIEGGPFNGIVGDGGELPPPLTIEALRKPHASLPHNPLIAEPLFLTRYIEKAGTGILDMFKQCKVAGNPPPTFHQHDGQFIQTLRLPKTIAAQVGAHDQAHELLSEAAQALLRSCSRKPQATFALLKALGYASRTGNFKRALTQLLSHGLVEMTLPSAPRSKNQQYCVTAKGRACLDTHPNSDRTIT